MMPVRWILGSLMVSSLLLAGCSTPPKGDSGGRVDRYDSTRDEADSSRILPVTLIEFSEDGAERFVVQLNDLPIVRDAQERVTILLGDINNQTGIVATSEFDAASRRLRSILINAPQVREKVRWVEDRARLRSHAAREEVVNADGGLAEADAYNADTTFVLNVDVFRHDRGDTNSYYLEFTLAHFGSNELVYSYSTDVRQEAD